MAAKLAPGLAKLALLAIAVAASRCARRAPAGSHACLQQRLRIRAAVAGRQALL